MDLSVRGEAISEPCKSVPSSGTASRVEVDGNERRVDLGLSSTAVTDLTPLAAMVSLTDLDVSDTNVKKVRALAKLKNLDQVDLRDTRVSRADAKWLEKLVPHVYWGEGTGTSKH